MQQTATLVQKRMLSPSVVNLSFSVAAPFAFAAGQWVNLVVETQPVPFRRAYSIASGPMHGPLELAVTRVPGGAVSPVLHELSLGTCVTIDGPHGMFTRDPVLKSRPALFVATGTGLAPFRSMLQEELPQADHAPICVLFGARTEADVLWREEFEALSRQNPNFRFEVTLSQPNATWLGRRGYVQAHLASLLGELATPDVYICGLNRMVSEVRATLKHGLGVDRKRIHSERYD